MLTNTISVDMIGLFGWKRNIMHWNGTLRTYVYVYPILHPSVCATHFLPLSLFQPLYGCREVCNHDMIGDTSSFSSNLYAIKVGMKDRYRSSWKHSKTQTVFLLIIFFPFLSSPSLPFFHRTCILCSI